MQAKRKHARFVTRLASLILTMVLLLSSSVIPVSAAGQPTDYSPGAAAYRNVMYYGDWSVWGGMGNFYPGGIPADQITHLNFAFVDFDAKANLVFTDADAATGASLGMSGVQWGGENAGILSALQQVRMQNPNLRVGVSIGGWSRSGDFSVVAANPALRAKLIRNLCGFLKYTNMDFLDVDWEYPVAVRPTDGSDEGTPNATPADKENYITLLTEMRAALNQQGQELGKTYELSVAIPATAGQLDTSIDIPALFQVVDFANVMTYDMSGSWNGKAGHHSALYSNPADPYAGSGLSVDASVKHLLAQGADPKKIVIGCAFYTRGWPKVANDGGVPGLPGLFGTAQESTEPFPNGGIWSYMDFGQMHAAHPGLEYYWDQAARAPYYYSKDTGAFFSFDDVRSVTEKANYVKKHKLGGIISWQQGQDRETVTGSGTRDLLTRALKQGLFGNADLTDYKVSIPQVAVTAQVKAYSTNDQKGFEITVTNQATANERDTVLKAVELQAETVKLPKIYIRSAGNASFSAADSGTPAVSMVNGYGVVDLSGMIPRGGSVTFRILTSGAADAADIQSMEISQRISSDGPEISRQLIPLQ